MSPSAGAFFLLIWARGLTDCSRADPSGSGSIFLVPPEHTMAGTADYLYLATQDISSSSSASALYRHHRRRGYTHTCCVADTFQMRSYVRIFTLFVCNTTTHVCVNGFWSTKLRDEKTRFLDCETRHGFRDNRPRTPGQTPGATRGKTVGSLRFSFDKKKKSKIFEIMYVQNILKDARFTIVLRLENLVKFGRDTRDWDEIHRHEFIF